jgi:hypothetical protein
MVKNSKLPIIIYACVLLVVMSGMAMADVPGNPTSLTNTTGNYWVNHSWTAGANTDSYNVSINGVWHNTTANTFYKASYNPSVWQNITVFGYNSADAGNLSSGSVSQNTQAPARSGMDLSSVTAILGQIPGILAPIPDILAALDLWSGYRTCNRYCFQSPEVHTGFA